MEPFSTRALPETLRVTSSSPTGEAPGVPGVVILSDVRLYREGLALSLARRGELAVRGVAAPAELDVAALIRADAAVLLLDASMRGAIEIVKRLKLEAPEVKVVTVSVNDSDDDRLAHIEAGAAGCVSRDGSIDEVVQAVLDCSRGKAACSATLAARLFDRVAALSSAARPLADQPWLTHRELQLLRLVDEGLSNKEIARNLGLGLPTVKNHVHRILEKLSVRRRGEAAAWLRAQDGIIARGMGIIRNPEGRPS